jgi:hypothetical protein
MKWLYVEEYLRTPDALHLKRNSKLHKEERHGASVMFDSLDCMHRLSAPPLRKIVQRDYRHHSKAGKKLAVQP